MIHKYISWGLFIGGSITAIGFLIRYLIQKRIDFYFNKKLEIHKNELAILTENTRYEVNKKLFDFEAYASKKHAVYPELYQQAFKPWYKLSHFTYQYNESVKKDLTAKKLSLLFDEWLSSIDSEIIKAEDYFNENELYLSESTASAYIETLQALSHFIVEYNDKFHRYIAFVEWTGIPNKQFVDEFEAKKKAEEKINILKKTIYKELSYSHSE